jgi:aldose 1-epimerase
MSPALTLESESLRASLLPERGASVLGLSLRLRGAWVDVWRPAPDPLTRSGDAASYLLAPYSNRLRDGRFAFRGRVFDLAHPLEHALHGDVRERAFHVTERSADAVRLELDAGALPDLRFPFPFRAESWLRLRGASVEHGLAVVNTGAEPMPAGLGFHPYWMRALGDAREDAEIAFRVAGAYPGAPPVPMLPTGAAVPLTPEQDFSRPRRLEIELDHCFAGWDGRARVRWPASGVTARLVSSPSLGHVVVYSPAGKPWFAFEPVTHANDGFNLMERGVPGTGVVVLAPGERLEGSFRVELEISA